VQREGPQLADKAIPELLRQLSADTATLVRQEMQLARAELAEKGKKAGASAGLFGGSAVFGLAAFGALTITLIAVLALVIPIWAAALIVAVLYGVIAAVAALLGKSSLKKVGTPVPERAVESIKQDVTTVREGAQRGR
jgi:uncharacterized membrane protein YqjE